VDQPVHRCYRSHVRLHGGRGEHPLQLPVGAQVDGNHAFFGHLNLQEKREQRDVLSVVFWDIETEQARARA